MTHHLREKRGIRLPRLVVIRVGRCEPFVITDRSGFPEFFADRINILIKSAENLRIRFQGGIRKISELAIEIRALLKEFFNAPDIRSGPESG